MTGYIRDRSAVVRERAGVPPGAEPSITGYIWDKPAVVQERAGSRPGAEPSITRYIWDKSAVVRERAGGCLRAQPSIRSALAVVRELVCSLSYAVLQLISGWSEAHLRLFLS